MDKDQYEANRIAALKKRRREAARYDKRSLEVRYGPGSFGCHEAFHVTKLVVDLIDDRLMEHSAVLLDSHWYYCVKEAQALLYGAYNAVGGDHLSAPLPAEDQSSIGPKGKKGGRAAGRRNRKQGGAA